MVSKNILLEGLNWFHGTQTSPLVQMWIITQKQNIIISNNSQKNYRLGMVSKDILLEGLNRFHAAPTLPLF